MSLPSLEQIRALRFALSADESRLKLVARILERAEPSLLYMIEALENSLDFITRSNPLRINQEINGFENIMTEWGERPKNPLACSFEIPTSALGTEDTASPAMRGLNSDGNAFGVLVEVFGGGCSPFPPCKRTVHLIGRKTELDPCKVSIAATDTADCTGAQVEPFIEFCFNRKRKIKLGQLQSLCKGLSDETVTIVLLDKVRTKIVSSAKELLAFHTA